MISNILVFFSLIQILNGTKDEEYIKKIEEQKFEPKVTQFLKNNELFFTQYKIFGEKLENTILQILENDNGYKTLRCLKNETDIILKEETANKILQKISSAALNIMTSTTGSNNIMAIRKNISTLLLDPIIFEMGLCIKRMLIELLISEDGLEASVLLKQQAYDMQHIPKYAAARKFIDDLFSFLNK